MKKLSLIFCSLVAVAPLPALAWNKTTIYYWDNMVCTVLYQDDVMLGWSCRARRN